MGPWTWSVAFSPDGKTLAVASQTGIVRLWEPVSGHLRASLQGHTASVRCVSFSPDGKTLASASDDRTVRLWDTATGQEKVTLKAHTAAVHALAFSHEGSTLATASADGTVRLWRASTEQEAKEFRAELDPDEADSPAALFDAAGRLKSAGRAEESQRAYEKALARLEKLAGALNDADYPKKLRAAYGGAINLRGESHAELGQWKEAAADFAKAVELNNDDPLPRYRQALARLQLGDVAGYRKLCADML